MPIKYINVKLLELQAFLKNPCPSVNGVKGEFNTNGLCGHCTFTFSHDVKINHFRFPNEFYRNEPRRLTIRKESCAYNCNESISPKCGIGMRWGTVRYLFGPQSAYHILHFLYWTKVYPEPKGPSDVCSKHFAGRKKLIYRFQALIRT